MCKLYPLLAKLPPPPSTISPQFRTILLAAGHVAAGDANGATSAFRHISQALHAKAYELAIVQAMPFIGIPRALHSAASLQVLGIVGDTQHSSLDCLSSLQHNGQETFKLIYGRNASRVRKRLKQFHPFIDEWIVSCNYGAVLSRKGITLRERELAAVAALSVDKCAAVQLASHIRGALKMGATEDELCMIIEHGRLLTNDDDWKSADAVLQTWHRARYAL